MKRLILIFTVVSCSASELSKVAEPIVSDSPAVEELAKSTFIMEDFFFLNDEQKEEHYWPTRHCANPFLKEEATSNPFLEDLRSEPGYTYQTKPHQFLEVKDEVHGKRYQSEIMVNGKVLLVGPTKQGRYASSTYGNELHIFRERNDLLELQYVYTLGDTEQITAVTMDPQAGYFYAATKSGKVHCCTWQVTLDDRCVVEWRGSLLPLRIASSIDDIELDSKGEKLYILSQNSIYAYHKEAGLKVLDLALADEALVVIRSTSEPNEVLVGGAHGTVFLADLAAGQWYILDSSEKGAAILDMWWTSTNRVAFLNGAGLIRVGRISKILLKKQQEDAEGQEETPYHLLKVGENFCIDAILEMAEHRLRAGDRMDLQDRSGNTILHRLGIHWYEFLTKREPIDLFLNQMAAHLLKRLIQEIASEVSTNAAENRIVMLLLCCREYKIPKVAVKIILTSSTELLKDMGLMICSRYLKSKLTNEQLSQEGLIFSVLYPIMLNNIEVGEVLDKMKFPMEDSPVLDTLMNYNFILLPLGEPALNALSMSTTLKEFKRAQDKHATSLNGAVREVMKLVIAEKVGENNAGLVQAAQKPPQLLKLIDLIKKFLTSGQLAEEKIPQLLLLMKEELFQEILLIKNHKGQTARDLIVEAGDHFE